MAFLLAGETGPEGGTDPFIDTDFAGLEEEPGRAGPAHPTAGD
jgi:hypothetical protein